MHDLTISAAGVALRLTTPVLAVAAHFEAVLMPSWPVDPSPRSTRLLHATIDPARHRSLATLVACNDPAERTQRGFTVALAHDPWFATIAQTSHICCRIPADKDAPIEVVGLDEHDLAVATALLARDIVRSEAEADGWRLFPTAAIPKTNKPVRPRPWTLIKATIGSTLHLASNPSDRELGFGLADNPPQPEATLPRPGMVIVPGTDDYMLAIAPILDAEKDTPPWLCAPSLLPPATAYDAKRFEIEQVLRAHATYL